MNVQVIMKEGEPEYAILPYAEYQALLKAARQTEHAPHQANTPPPASKTPHTAPDTAQPFLPQASQTQSSENDSPGSFSGSQVKALRETKNIDSATLARGIGISPLYLAQIEAGERMPGDAIWHNIARELQVSQDALKTAE